MQKARKVIHTSCVIVLIHVSTAIVLMASVKHSTITERKTR